MPGCVVTQVVLPVNGDPFIGMFETPVTSSPLVAGFLSNLPAYRTQVSPLLRGTEIGLAHGFLVVSPPRSPSMISLLMSSRTASLFSLFIIGTFCTK